MFKVNNKDTRTMPSGVFIANFEHISHFVLVFFIVNFEQVNAGWDIFHETTNLSNIC